MLQENIPWFAISEKLSTRTDADCCMKWYKWLTLSIVAEGLWAHADDYCLIDALSSWMRAALKMWIGPIFFITDLEMYVGITGIKWFFI